MEVLLLAYVPTLIAFVILLAVQIHDRAYFKTKIKNLRFMFDAMVDEMQIDSRNRLLERVRKKMLILACEKSNSFIMPIISEDWPDPSPRAGITRDDIPPKGAPS